jgi:hypothetical protein
MSSSKRAAWFSGQARIWSRPAGVHAVEGLIKSYSRPLEQKVSHFPQILFGLSSHGRRFGRGTGGDCHDHGRVHIFGGGHQSSA